MTVDIAPLMVPLLVAAIAWLGPRVTRTRRLLTELRRLGEARSLLPPSAERDRLDMHIEGVARSLNEWMDPSRKRARRRQNSITWTISTLGGLAVLMIQIFISDPPTRTAMMNIAVVFAVLLGGAAMLIIERLATNREQRLAALEHEHASQARTASLLDIGAEGPDKDSERR